MTQIEVNGVSLSYEERGSGPEAILFAHGLLMNRHMFEGQIAALEARYRCLAFDFRGQGDSQVTDSGYDMDTLYEDTAALITKLGCQPCHLVGFSMGGFVALRLAARRPELLRSLILIDTSAEAETWVKAAKYRLLNFMQLRVNRPFAIRQAMKVLFGHKFLNDPARAQEREAWYQHILTHDKIGTARAVNGVIERKGVLDEVPAISAPTLIISGEEDAAIAPEESRALQALIAGSQLVTIPKAGHTTPVEAPEAVSEAIKSFLATLGGAGIT